MRARRTASCSPIWIASTATCITLSKGRRFKNAVISAAEHTEGAERDDSAPSACSVASAQGNGDAVAGVILDIFDMQELLSKLFLRDQIWGFVKALRELSNGPNVGFLSTFG